MLLVFSASMSLPVPAPGAPPALAEGDVAALLPAVRAVIAAVLAVGREHPDVEDATSETMRRAVEGRGRVRDGDPVRPWLLGIARHVALDARRTRGRTVRRTPPEPRASGDESLLDRIPTHRPDPFEQVAQARRDARVRDALTRLPEGSRRALTLFHLEGLGYEEIGVRLGVPGGTVATWISRGRRALAGELADEGEEG